MNKITMICEEEDSKTTTERTIEEDMDIYFLGRCFYEFLKGIGFNEEVIDNILITDGLYDI
jgi:hypothetical protein